MAGNSNLNQAKPAVVLEPALERQITAFLNAKALKKPRTQQWYQTTLRMYGEHLTEAGLEQWSSQAETIADNINSFLAAARQRGCSDATLSNYYRALCAWLRWLTRRQRIEGKVIDLIEKPPKVAPLPKVAKVEDVARLLQTLEQAACESWVKLRDWAIIVLALDSGARIGELAGLTLNKLDMEQRTIAATYTKSGHDRTIVFSETAARPLARWLEARARLKPSPGLASVFISNYRGKLRPLTAWGMRQSLSKWQKRAGIDHFNFHRLRHSYAVYTLRAGGDILDVQRQMGHTNIATTAIYTRVDDTDRQARHNSRNPLAYLGGGAHA